MKRYFKVSNGFIIRIVVGVLAWILCAHPLTVIADVRLPHIFGSHMVVQREMPVKIWGWADGGETVSVRLGKSEGTVNADSAGNWMVVLPAMKATAKPLKLTVSGKNRVHMGDILVGEVWICSGQSNMNMIVKYAKDAKKEIAQSRNPNIRFFTMPLSGAGYPSSDVESRWFSCNPKTVWRFSAVGYFFGKALYKQLDVPIGLIHASRDGSTIEPWIPSDGFAQDPEFKDIVEEKQKADKAYQKKLIDSIDAIEEWTKLSRKAVQQNMPVSPVPDLPRHGLDGFDKPSALYNAMLHPLVPYAIRGFIWYQGEANCGDGMGYHKKMKLLINALRSEWGEGDFPFYYVQLTPFRYEMGQALPEMWEAQTATLSVPNTGMAVTTDIGNPTVIHPWNKQEVGRRLALWALARTYDRELVYSGPLYKSMEKKSGRIIIRFDHTGSGLSSRDGGTLTWFEIAGKDRKFVDALAEIKNNTVVVWNEKIPDPAAVRFGWHEDAQPNFMNKEGLPASPFRTDAW